MKMRPSKWLLYSPVVVLPFVAAFAVSTKSTLEDVADRATLNLAAQGAQWSKLTFDGRDASLAGDAPDAEALDAAVKAVTGTRGVRTVHNIGRVVEPS